MLTFTDRLNAIKAAAIDQIKLSLAKCEGCEYKLRGLYVQFREDSWDRYELKHIREDRGKVYVLGELYSISLYPEYGKEDEYDFEIDELSDRNIAYIAGELVTI